LGVGDVIGRGRGLFPVSEPISVSNAAIDDDFVSGRGAPDAIDAIRGDFSQS
jgi:hypothetical protein